MLWRDANPRLSPALLLQSPRLIDKQTSMISNPTPERYELAVSLDGRIETQTHTHTHSLLILYFLFVLSRLLYSPPTATTRRTFPAYSEKNDAITNYDIVVGVLFTLPHVMAVNG